MCAAAHAASAPAAAPAYDDYTYFNKIKVEDQGDYKYTDEVKKRDYFDYAVVYITEGAISPEPGRIQTYKRGGGAVTKEETFPRDTRYELKYYEGEGTYGDYYSLRFSSQRFGFTASGYWAP